MITNTTILFTYYCTMNDIKTRWNSTYYMLQRFEQMEPALRLFEVEYPVISNLLPDTEGWIKIRVRKKINY